MIDPFVIAILFLAILGVALCLEWVIHQITKFVFRRVMKGYPHKTMKKADVDAVLREHWEKQGLKIEIMERVGTEILIWGERPDEDEEKSTD
jgi:hypothetical protein